MPGTWETGGGLPKYCILRMGCFHKVGICWDVSLAFSVLTGCFSSLPHPIHLVISTCGVCSPWGTMSPCTQRPPAGLPCLEMILRVVPDISALRGGAQRWPVPKRSRRADQLPVHGAHVPLCRGPGACVESHGRSRGQQVSFSHCSQLLSWSQQLSGPHSVLVLRTRQVCTPPSLLVTDFLPLLLASAGLWQLGLPFPPPTCSREPAATGRLIGPPSPVSCPTHPSPPRAGLPPGYYRAFFLLLNEFSISHHGQFSSFSSWSVQPRACCVPVRSREEMGHMGQPSFLPQHARSCSLHYHFVFSLALVQSHP